MGQMNNMKFLLFLILATIVSTQLWAANPPVKKEAIPATPPGPVKRLYTEEEFNKIVEEKMKEMGGGPGGGVMIKIEND